MNIGHREFSAEDPSGTTRRPSRAPAASMRTRVSRALAGHEEPFRRGSWPRFAFDDFSPPHTGPYLGLVSGGSAALRSLEACLPH